MAENPLMRLKALGQSIWLDYLRRDILLSGALRRMVEEDGVSGVTSNPTIFEGAITGSNYYDEAIRRLALQGLDARAIYDRITVEDVQMAADVLRDVFDATQGYDGYVSIEVSPYLARDTEGTIADAHRLWQAVDRPNVMIKVPGTLEGLPAIRALIADGVNVNVTLLFGLPRYRQVTQAYIQGIEDRLSSGKAVGQVASVASFFLSRIDVMVDPMLDQLIREGGGRAQLAATLRGEVAIASAKLAYQIYKETFHSAQFRKLGARPQRVLWASTSTKNPAYSDVKYVEPLIGPETINTVPQSTLDAYRDHGNPALRLEEDVARARWVLAKLAEIGIDMDQVTQRLEDEGIEKFAQSYDKALAAVEEKRRAIVAQVG
jgi:transaldolase